MSDITWRDACPHPRATWDLDEDCCPACDAAMLAEGALYYALYEGEKRAGLAPAPTEAEIRDSYADDPAKRAALLRWMGVAE